MIHTNRLVIKPYCDQDQESMIELLTNEGVKKTFMIPDFSCKEQAIAMFLKLKDMSSSEEHYERGIYLNNHLIGFVNDVEIDDKSIELGYVIHPDHHNHGYATEVLQAVIKDLFQRGYDEVLTGAFDTNHASIRVMEKCGMKRIDKVDEIPYHGETHHCIYYSIRKENKNEA